MIIIIDKNTGRIEIWTKCEDCILEDCNNCELVYCG